LTWVHFMVHLTWNDTFVKMTLCLKFPKFQNFPLGNIYKNYQFAMVAAHDCMIYSDALCDTLLPRLSDDVEKCCRLVTFALCGGTMAAKLANFQEKQQEALSKVSLIHYLLI